METIKNYRPNTPQFRHRTGTGFYRMRPLLIFSILLLFVVITLIMFFYLTTIPGNPHPMAVTSKGRPAPDAGEARNVIRLAGRLKEITFTPVLLEERSGTTPGDHPLAGNPLKVKILDDAKYHHHYLFDKGSLILLGDFHLSSVQRLFEMPRVVVMKYNGSFFHLRKIDGEIWPLEQELDSAVIRQCLAAPNFDI